MAARLQLLSCCSCHTSFQASSISTLLTLQVCQSLESCPCMFNFICSADKEVSLDAVPFSRVVPEAYETKAWQSQIPALQELQRPKILGSQEACSLDQDELQYCLESIGALSSGNTQVLTSSWHSGCQKSAWKMFLQPPWETHTYWWPYRAAEVELALTCLIFMCISKWESDHPLTLTLNIRTCPYQMTPAWEPSNPSPPSL